MNVTSATNHRTSVSAILPDAATDYSVRLVMPNEHEPCHFACLTGLLNSFAFDYQCRQKLPGSQFLRLYHVPASGPEQNSTPESFGLIGATCLGTDLYRLGPRAISKTAGFPGAPFRWDEERRFLLRCELDAAFFHLYLPAQKGGDWRPVECEKAEDLARLKASFPTPRDAVAYIMDTFPIVRRKDEEKYDGDYRTKRVILEIYDTMSESIRTGGLTKPASNPHLQTRACCHPPGGDRTPNQQAVEVGHDGQASVNGGHQLRRRPGPFGPAWALLPKGQQPLTVEDTTLIYDALDRMMDNNYSQIPVRNKEGKIIGVSRGSRSASGSAISGELKRVFDPSSFRLKRPWNLPSSSTPKSISTRRPIGPTSTTCWLVPTRKLWGSSPLPTSLGN